MEMRDNLWALLREGSGETNFIHQTQKLKLVFVPIGFVLLKVYFCAFDQVETTTPS